MDTRPRSRFLSNTAALVVQTVVITVVTLLQVKVLAKFLSKDLLGLFASIRGLSLLLSMLAASGLPQLLVRFMPVHESGQRRAAIRLSIYSLAAATGLVVVLAAVTWLGRGWVFSFAGPEAASGPVLVWFYVMTLAVAVKLVLYGGLNGLRRISVQAMLEVVSQLAILVCIVAWRDTLSLSMLLTIFGGVHVVTVAAGLPVYANALRRIGGPPRPDVAGTRPGYRSYLLWASGLSFVALAFTDVDRYILAQVLTLELLAVFHIAARISRLANRVLAVANLAFQPEVTRIDTQGRSREVAHSTSLFLKFNSLVAFWLTFAIVFFAKELVIIVSSREYETAGALLVILAWSLPLTTATAPITTVMKARDQVRAALICDLLWMITYVGLIFALGRAYGLFGVGVAQLAACAVQLGGAVTLSRLDIRPAFLASLYAKLLLAGAISFSPVIVLRSVGGGVAPGIVISTAIALFLLGSVVYPLLLRRMGLFSVDERARLQSILGGRGSILIERLL